MVVMNATKARSNFYQILNDDLIGPITITGKKNNKVLVDEDEWRAIQETLYLESVPGLKDSILNAHNEPDDSLVDASEVKW